MWIDFFFLYGSLHAVHDKLYEERWLKFLKTQFEDKLIVE